LESFLYFYFIFYYYFKTFKPLDRVYGAKLLKIENISVAYKTLKIIEKRQK